MAMMAQDEKEEKYMEQVGPPSLQSKVEIYISLRDLLCKDFASLSDPFVVGTSFVWFNYPCTRILVKTTKMHVLQFKNSKFTKQW